MNVKSTRGRSHYAFVPRGLAKLKLPSLEFSSLQNSRLAQVSGELLEDMEANRGPYHMVSQSESWSRAWDTVATNECWPHLLTSWHVGFSHP
jgi:hypothetical protein